MTVKSAPMIDALLTFIAAVAATSGDQQKQSAPEKASYATSVSFFKNSCQFWTGDVAFDATGFRDDLRHRFDTSRGLVVFHDPHVPTQCVAKALEAARQAGFQDVRHKSGRVDLGPPR